MNVIKYLLLFSILLVSSSWSTLPYGQDQLPNIQVQTLNGQSINIRSLRESGKPMLISFWATWCKPCIKELDAINEVLEDWQDEVDFNVVAISVDDTRSLSRVRPFVNGRGWEIPVYLDQNADLKRALGVNNIPHVLIVDAAGKIVWQHASYQMGDEENYYKVLHDLSEKSSGNE